MTAATRTERNGSTDRLIKLRVLHRRLAAALGLTALTAFISGAGLDTPSPLLATTALLLALVWAPGEKLQRLLDPVWRALALILTARAVYSIVVSPEDVVLPTGRYRG